MEKLGAYEMVRKVPLRAQHAASPHCTLHSVRAGEEAEPHRAVPASRQHLERKPFPSSPVCCRKEGPTLPTATLLLQASTLLASAPSSLCVESSLGQQSDHGLWEGVWPGPAAPSPPPPTPLALAAGRAAAKLRALTVPAKWGSGAARTPARPSHGTFAGDRPPPLEERV